MAATAITPAQAELISSLTQDEVPIKLRCAICSKLAVNAYKLPCCEQAICETCHSTLPSSCPVCEHSPLSASDCNPNKALRTTIRVFLKTEEKKRGIGQPKEKDATPVTPVEPKDVTPSVIPEKVGEIVEVTDAADASQSQDDHALAAPSEELKGTPVVEEAIDANTSSDAKDAPSQGYAPDSSGDAENTQIVEHEGGDLAAEEHKTVQVGEAHDNDEEAENDGQPGGDSSNSFGFDAANGGFPNMNFGNGDFNQMQMMMAMQNGMGPNNFGGFPMMAGMSGMMDPMMMQNMYMNGGFGSQGMGMNGMMGMGGFNGGVGSGSDNNWNDQQSWNVGQDNFNQPNASGMGNGDYGNFNSGFQTGYNQGNFGHHNQFNDYRGNRFGYGRGRGRGRGGYGYGRGGYGYGMNGNYGGQNYMSQQYSAGTGGQTPNDSQTPGVVSGDTNQADGVDEYGRTLRPDDGEAGDSENAAANETGDKGAGQEQAEGTGGTDKTSGDDGLAEGAAKPIPALGDTGSASNGGITFQERVLKAPSLSRRP
ncbi:putative pre-mrna-splicing factor 38b protein [Phaeoacremonium minimum UCRPA7]|uniref:Putative pre-mrna-splicing factor 38b protein n=1 Tax=Phaeoacremonium minimum (strain UCR-PA7) TaxID=1286976 RepID=R8BFS2_PHAM7|nr:putative pre-mrna-splicing factor 38b protein [Phaeoacremonium minimum UCRPA7]EON98150.1 putative pre-mrna-splicing factor 38b protein [Phaeoacremonium minimum UCRPA7]